MSLFSYPRVARNQSKYLGLASAEPRTWGGGPFGREAAELLREYYNSRAVLLTQSCTNALELAALTLNLGPDDEIIVPSYTFVSSASAFAARGAKVRFAEIDDSDLNLSLDSVTELLTPKTKAVVAVHYGGVFPKIEELQNLCKNAGVFLIEDAAQSIGSTVRGRPLGSFGDLACVSFHGTKNLSSGEGGALVVNSTTVDLGRLETMYEKGTDRSAFLRGEVDKYTWKALGSSFIPSEFTAAVVLAQLEELSEITQLRTKTKAEYLQILVSRSDSRYSIVGPSELLEGENAHLMGVMLSHHIDRGKLIGLMRDRGVTAASHYVPLHNSPFALDALGYSGALAITEDLASRILRLPVWSAERIDVAKVTQVFFECLDRAGSK